MSNWQIHLTEEVEDWLLRLDKDDPDSAHQVAAAVKVLSEEGPPVRLRPSAGSHPAGGR